MGLTVVLTSGGIARCCCASLHFFFLLYFGGGCSSAVVVGEGRCRLLSWQSMVALHWARIVKVQVHVVSVESGAEER